MHENMKTNDNITNFFLKEPLIFDSQMITMPHARSLFEKQIFPYLTQEPN